MLGRYVAGTLLILGVAMVMAPPAPETPDLGAEVTRGDSAPSALAAPVRVVATATPAASAPAAVPSAAPAANVAAPVAAAPAPARGSDAALEAAILEALNIDQSEQGLGTTEAETVARAVAQESFPDEDAPEAAEPGLLAGLADPGFLATPTESLRASEDSSTLLVTGNRVNVRSGPSTQYSVVGTVFGGDQVELVSFADDNWVQVRLVDGAEGYMARSFLQAN